MTELTFQLKRPLYPPSAGKGTFSGEDVLAIKRVTSRAGFWPWQEFDEVYSEAFAKGKKDTSGKLIAGWEGVAGLEKALKVTPATGNWGKGAHAASQKYRIPAGRLHTGDRIWDQFSINLYQGFEDMTAAEKLVADIFAWWDWLVARANLVHYTLARPIHALVAEMRPPELPTDLDCSGTAIYCAWLAGALSPDPWGFSGFGSTSSLITRGVAIPLADVDKWARDHYVLAFFGPSRWNTKHVTAVKSSTKSYSNGREQAPEVYDTVEYRSDFIECRAYEVI